MTTRIWACRALLRHYEQQPSGVWTPPCCGLENIETEKRLAWVYTALPQLSILFFDNKLRLTDSHLGPANIKFKWSDNPDLNGFGCVRVSRRHGDIPITIKIDRKILETEFWETNVIVVLIHQMVHAYFVVECVYRGAYDSRDYGYETKHDIPFCVLLYKISQNFKTIIPLDHLLYSEPYIVESECPSHDSWYEDNGTGFCYWRSVNQHGVPPEVLEDCARLICEGRDLPENPRRPRLNANFNTSTQIAQTETTDEQDHGSDDDDDHGNSAGGPHEGRGDDSGDGDDRYHGRRGRDRGNHNGGGDRRGGNDDGNGDSLHATRARQERESYVNRRQEKRPCTRPQDEDSNGPSEHWQAPYPKDDEWDRRAHPPPQVEDAGRSQHTGQGFVPRPTRHK
ncbi:hypothetical protein KEM56_002670 [Ascosphaera pollenicola]|nr:hypothetical protein KEM56_002670 [Ascosphaera pollenicola]